jgi:hypothetical protein
MANGTLKVENIQTSSGSGTITLGQSGETITIPTGTTVSGAMANTPSFSAYGSVSVPNTTFTKVTCDTEEFDTNSNYDNSTNGSVHFLNAAMNNVIVSLYKNGSEFKRGSRIYSSGVTFPAPVVSALIYLNGSTDYIEMFVYQDSGGTLSTETSLQLHFCIEHIFKRLGI